MDQIVEKNWENAKVLQVRKSTARSGWNNHLPVPLKEKERVMVHPNQDKVGERFVRVKHGKGFRTVSVFGKDDFLILK